jgi:hypothetical protein
MLRETAAPPFACVCAVPLCADVEIWVTAGALYSPAGFRLPAFASDRLSLMTNETEPSYVIALKEKQTQTVNNTGGWVGALLM